MKRANRFDKHGFTLMEVLVTVGVLVILLALFSIPLAKHMRELRQTELDSKAELIFTTVQNQMTKLRSLGNESSYNNTTAANYTADFKPYNYDSEETLSYVTSDEAFDAVTDKIFPDDAADAELRNGSWIIEFDKKSGSVYAVFFMSAREDIGYDGEEQWKKYNDLRSKNNRLSGGAKVGYYSGTVVEIEDTGKLAPEIEIINKDILQVIVTCKMKGNLTDVFNFDITITGIAKGTTDTYKTVTVSGTTNSAALDDRLTIEQQYPNYVATLTLDKLESGKQFKELFNNAFEPGCDLTISAKVSNKTNSLVDEGTAEPKTTNSLFASKNGSEATISYARHLQNLDTVFSGSNNITISTAIQNNNIDFKSEAENEWYTLYDEKTFTPIVNTSLTKLEAVGTNGTNPVIYDITIDNSQNSAGLFKEVSGNLELKNIYLLGARVKGSNVGALIGDVKGTVTLNGCRVYLSSTKGHLSDSDKKWLNGENVGGLIGNVESNATVTITNSLAATVCNGENVGGLIGNLTSAELNISTSYADCYLYGTSKDAKLGGLIGYGDGATTLTLTNSYAAGLICGKTNDGNDAKTAGIAVMPLDLNDNISNFYTACAAFKEVNGELKKTDLSYTTVELRSSVNATNVYYLNQGTNNANIGTQVNWNSKNIKDAVDKLCDAFTADVADTTAYNLKVSGLGSYTYPKLKDIHHYGDWLAGFEDGVLVYYEQYSNNTNGFFGANTDTLNNEAVVTHDGYGVVYNAMQTETLKVNDQEYTLSEYIEVKKGSTTYYIYPLDFDKCIDIGFEALPDDGSGKKSYYCHVEIGNITYSYNPHFAKTVKQGKATSLNKEDSVIVRTARHLYDISAYYEKYCDMIHAETVFTQERGLDYQTYTAKTITEQAPIGVDAPFAHTYDGNKNKIEHAPLIMAKESASGNDKVYSGLFAKNNGNVKNVVLLATMDKSPVKISIAAQSTIGYIGTLAGLNSGTITNCSVSGYAMEAKVYASGTVYVGGIVGYNDGMIKNSSAAISSMDGASNYSTLYVGGMVGSNHGQVRKSYAVGAISVIDIKESEVSIAGFVADNHGTVSESYCAVSIISANATTNGFASHGGNTRSCYYLNDGAYEYCGNIAMYNSDDSNSGVKGVNFDSLLTASKDLFSFAAVKNTENNYYENNQGEDYPFGGIVDGKDGNKIHYGAWPTKIDLGIFGMFYWEKEEGGANAGYHFSYIGTDNGKDVANSNLCEVHDDGGVITEYGYGYYWKGDNVTPTCTIDNNTVENLTKNTEASEELGKQVVGYSFCAYTTGMGTGKLCVTSNRNQTWTLTQQGSNTLYFEVSPFFGNAFVKKDSDKPLGSVKDGCKSYEVRSVDQLQYINWNSAISNVTTYVTSTTYKQFPYLQYATVTDKGTQTRYDAEKDRSQQSWKQTHDLNGADLNDSANSEKNKTFYPIAGAVEDMSSSGYALTLYTWFGGKYDGGNYYIKNININSYAYNVGLFGTTAGAEIKNIILYSDNSASITRETDATPSNGSYNVRNYPSSYALGGLVGIAYDYASDMGNSTISNCAIAGYKIIDNSKNIQQTGEAGVGGLIGVSSVNLKECSAVVDIEINCTHKFSDTNKFNSAKSGNFIRVGGLVGGLRYSATDCYTGGSIKVSKDTLDELNIQNKQINNKNTLCRVKTETTYVYISGIGGSGFSATYQNFVNDTSAKDGNQIYENCYTYMELPNMEGTIIGIALIGSTADRYGQYGASIDIKNCYYLDSIVENIKIDFGDNEKYKIWDYWCKNSNTGVWERNVHKYTLSEVLSDDKAKMDMLYGKSDYVVDCLNYARLSEYTGTIPTSKTYAEMSSDDFIISLNNGSLIGSWSSVTTTEGEYSIDGKFSFPGDSTELLGQNYPFPTVLKQGNDSLHYGKWTQNGLYWEKGIDSVDIIADGGSIKQTLVFYDDNGKKVEDKNFNGVTFTYSKDGIVEAMLDNDGKTVVLTALDVGTTVITATLDGKTATLTITVTAKMTLDILPAGEISLPVGNSQEIVITVKDKNGTDITNKVSYSFESSNMQCLPVQSGALNKENKLTLKASAVPSDGEPVALNITVTYGKKYEVKTIITVNITS